MGAPTTRQPLLDVAGLRVTYGGVVAVSDVDLQVPEGTVYGLIGPNGAGKTSMVDDLTVDENLLVASEHVTVASALRDLFLPHRPPNRTGVDWAISVCGLEDVVDRYPSEISLGKRKLVGIGRALARQPRLVLLDEPAA